MNSTNNNSNNNNSNSNNGNSNSTNNGANPGQRQDLAGSHEQGRRGDAGCTGPQRGVCSRRSWTK